MTQLFRYYSPEALERMNAPWCVECGDIHEVDLDGDWHPLRLRNLKSYKGWKYLLKRHRRNPNKTYYLCGRCYHDLTGEY